MPLELTGKKSELPTPCLLMDVDAVNRNIEKMAKFFSAKKCKLRPHAKTHKLPWIAHLQIRAGAIGITCAKLQDAKGFIEAGIKSVLIANQIVDQIKIRELVELSRIAQLMVCIDDFNNAKELSMAAKRAGTRLDVLVEVDVGINRCGVLPGQPTVEFVKSIISLEGISFKGLMGYEGGLFNMTRIESSPILPALSHATTFIILESGTRTTIADQSVPLCVAFTPSIWTESISPLSAMAMVTVGESELNLNPAVIPPKLTVGLTVSGVVVSTYRFSVS